MTAYLPFTGAPAFFGKGKAIGAGAIKVLVLAIL